MLVKLMSLLLREQSGVGVEFLCQVIQPDLTSTHAYQVIEAAFVVELV